MAIILILLVIVILILIVAIIGYYKGLFRFEKIVIENEYDSDLMVDLVNADEESLSGIDLDDGIPLKEKMDINDYFGDNKAANTAAEEFDPGQNDEKFIQFDTLCSDFKVGRGYRIECQKALDEARKEGLMYVAVCFDIDRFRFINSLKGFSIGDYVLTRIGQELPSVFPEGALCTRISADHFAAILPLVDHDMFEQCADRLKIISEKICGDMGIKSGLRICIGIALTENVDRDYDVSTLLLKADIARHCIKVSRSETYKAYDPAMLATYLYGESAMDDYSENQFDEEFVIYYTPQDDISVHRLVGCEALVRWACEDNVDNALPNTMNKNKIPTNSSKVVYQVCKTMSRWRKAGKQVLPVNVSIPVTELYKEDFDEFLAKCLSEFQLAPAMLSIVVEASIIRLDWSMASAQLKKLREIGVKVGVDEIDTGYSNLEFLAGLPLQFVKLHRSFAAGVDTDPERKERARSMLAMAKALNLRVIFEGVDDPGQADALREIGAVVIQGACSGRPRQSDNFVVGLPECVEKQKNSGDVTVILDSKSLSRGDFKLF